MTNRLVQGAIAIVAVLVLWGWGSAACGLSAANERADAELLRANRLAGEAAAERTRANGMAVQLQASQEGSVRERMAADSTLAGLGRDLEASRVRVTELVRAVAEAEGGGTSGADTVVIVGDQVASFSGRFADGYLEALWTARVPDRSLELDYRTTVELELVRGVAGDGRVWVSGRAIHPAARLQLDTLFVDLPEPEVVRKNSFGRRVVDVLIGAAGGVVLCAVAC